MVTDASVHDSQALGDLISEQDAGQALYADGAYASEQLDEVVKRCKMVNRIHQKGYRNRPLTDDRKQANALKSKTRARVEHVVAFMEQSMHSLFAGDWDQKEELSYYISKTNLEKYCIQLGRIPQESLAKYYAIATLYVIPSLHEGKSMSLIEAMFNSLPIIASNAPGINDIIFDKQNGLLFEIDDVSGLAHCIRSLIEDRALAMIFAEKALHD